MMPNMTMHKSPTTKDYVALMLIVPQPESPIIDKLVDENWGQITKLTEGIWDLFWESWVTTEGLNTCFLIMLRASLLL